MSASLAFCPRCQHNQFFIGDRGAQRCSVCGFASPEPPVSQEAGPNLAAGAVSVARVLLKVLLIMAAIVIVIIGVLFAGCALMLGGGHF